MYNAIKAGMENYGNMPKEDNRGIERGPEVRKFLADVPPEYVFLCHDGRIIRNLKELRDAFTVMSDETYNYHWNSEKKDFTNWARDVIGDMKLARDLEGATSQSLAEWQVATRIAYLIRH